MISNLVIKAKKSYWKGDKDETTPNKTHRKVRGSFHFPIFLTLTNHIGKCITPIAVQSRTPPQHTHAFSSIVKDTLGTT